MRILVLGGDGYLGWPTALHLSDRGHDVAVLDNFARRAHDDELGLRSLVPIQPLRHRVQAWRDVSGHQLEFFVGTCAMPGSPSTRSNSFVLMRSCIMPSSVLPRIR